MAILLRQPLERGRVITLNAYLLPQKTPFTCSGSLSFKYLSNSSLITQPPPCPSGTSAAPVCDPSAYFMPFIPSSETGAGNGCAVGGFARQWSLPASSERPPAGATSPSPARPHSIMHRRSLAGTRLARHHHCFPAVRSKRRLAKKRSQKHLFVKTLDGLAVRCCGTSGGERYSHRNEVQRCQLLTDSRRYGVSPGRPAFEARCDVSVQRAGV